MDIYLDDVVYATELASGANLGDLVDEVRDCLAAREAILVGVVCDGLDVTGAEYGESLTRPLKSLSRVDLQSADPQNLVTEALSKTDELIDEVEVSISKIADQLAQGSENEGLSRLADCCQSWLQIHQAVCNSVTMLGAENVPAVHDGRTFEQLMATPLVKLRELKEVIEGKDFVLLGDMLTYEMPEIHSTWRSVISSIGTLLPKPSGESRPPVNGGQPG